MEQQNLDKRKLLAAYKECFETDAGRMVLRHLEFHRTRITRDPDSPLILAFREGERSVVQMIHNLITEANHPMEEETLDA